MEADDFKDDFKLDYLLYDTYSERIEFTLEIAEPENILKDRSVVIVIDKPEARAAIVEELTRAELRVIPGKDLYQVINLIDTIEAPHALVIDMDLPHLGGYQSLQYVRDTHAWRNIPVLALVSLEAEATISCALHAGANNYLLKPFQPIDLILKLQELLLRHRDQSVLKCAA